MRVHVCAWEGGTENDANSKIHWRREPQGFDDGLFVDKTRQPLSSEVQPFLYKQKKRPLHYYKQKRRKLTNTVHLFNLCLGKNKQDQRSLKHGKFSVQNLNHFFHLLLVRIVSHFIFLVCELFSHESNS